jgi:hypothetical protein
MVPIAADTAIAGASTGSGIQRAQLTPITAATRLPPMIDHGCANGLAGTPNSNTAEAPIGAISKGKGALEPSAQWLTSPVSKIPNKAPLQARRRSVALTITGPGIKPRNHNQNNAIFFAFQFIAVRDMSAAISIGKFIIHDPAHHA